jgi:pyridoxamine 5'-phosphate oxidase-like protein
MNNTKHVYTLPRIMPASDVPAGVMSFLNGEDLLSKTQAVHLSTVDAEGWPHTALLSAGDVLALSRGCLRFAILAGSGTAANLVRDGRLTLSMPLDGGMCELRMRVRKWGEGTQDVPLALFEAEVERVRVHVAPYADVTSGIRFALHEPSAVLARWQRQVAALRAAF